MYHTKDYKLQKKSLTAVKRLGKFLLFVFASLTNHFGRLPFGQPERVCTLLRLEIVITLEYYGHPY